MPNRLRLRTAAAVAAVLVANAAIADVTTHESIALNLGGMIHMNGTSTEWTTVDRQRKDSDLRCEGFMSLLCGKNKSQSIVRLDKDVEWQVKPDKKTYLETPLPTAEERAAAKQKLRAMMDKLRECQKKQPQAAQGVDKSKCEMSPPKLEVKKTDDHATLIGHDARRTSVNMTQTCTDKSTGDICEMNYGFDVWLTTDEIVGLAEKSAFAKAFLKKMGLDESDTVLQGQVRQLMAQYADTLKELATKAQDLKGTPLKTSFHFAMGGEHCGNAKKQQANSGDEGDKSGLPGAGAIAGKVFGSLFSKKAKDKDSAPPASASPDTVALAEFTVETTGIETGAVSPDKFEIPSGFSRETPKPEKEHEMSCSANGE